MYHLNVAGVVVIVVVTMRLVVGMMVVLLLVQADAKGLHAHTNTNAHANTDAHVGSGDKVEEVRLRKILGPEGFADVHTSRCGEVLGADHLVSLKRQSSALKTNEWFKF